MRLRNTIGEKSCVYEAFLDAGLPVTNKMKTGGVTLGDVHELLKKHGYTIYKKENDNKPFFVSLKSNESFFVGRVWNDKRLHLEHHNGLDVVLEYDSESICMIATKSR